MTKEFILNTLLPYKEDPTTCATNEKGGYEYLTKDGKKCATKGRNGNFEPMIPLEELDIKRINKEIEILKTRI